MSGAASANEPILRVENLDKQFRIKRGKVVHAVDNVSLAIRKGHTLGLVGESGCGKSTLGRTIIRVYEPTSGSIYFEGENVSQIKNKNDRRNFTNKMQMIFQDPYACLNPRMTVCDIVAEGWDAQKMYRGKERHQRVVKLLETVGLNEEHANRYPHEFSGGQRQRVGIARALSTNPQFIICDEPISALDVSIQAQIMNMLVDLQQKLDLTYLFIAHDISMVRYVSDEIAVMYLGSIMEHASSAEVYKNPLHPYTKALFSAIPVPNPKLERQRRQILLKGDIPSPLNVPSGCKFSSRCPHATERCSAEVPVLRECAPGHRVACHHVENL